MAISISVINPNSDNLLRLDALIDTDGAYKNAATVKASVFADSIITLDAEAVVDKGGAPNEVGLQADAHGLVSGAYIRVVGTRNYDGEYTVTAAVSTDEITIEHAYTAETMIGKEEVYKGIEEATNLTLAYVAASDGKYEGIIPDTARFIRDTYYIIFVAISADAGASVVLMRNRWLARFAA